MYKSFFFLSFIISLACNILYGQDETTNPTGNWLCQTEYGSVSLSFLSENQLVYDGETLDYKIAGNTLKIQSNYVWTDYPFELNDSQLTIDFPEGYRLLFNKINKSNSNTSNENVKSGAQNTEGYYLNGTLCEYGSSSSSYGEYSSYSHTNRLYFDGRGNFQYGTESSYSGGGSGAYSSDNATDKGTYRISGNKVILTANDGSVYKLTVNFIQDDGRITELYYGESLYASGLCE
jgi:hypothetical protein